MRARSGKMLSLPWSVTDLPVPVTPLAQPPEAVLLSPAALLALVRFLRRRTSEDLTAETSPRRKR